VSTLKELAQSIREHEGSVIELYEELNGRANSQVERQLAQQLVNYQRFQLACLDLFEGELPDKFHCFGTITHNEVRVRSQPKGTAEVLDEINKGTPLIIKEFNGNWASVQLSSGASGFVFKDYVSCEF